MEFSVISIGKFSGILQQSAQAAHLCLCSREKEELEQKVRERYFRAWRKREALEFREGKQRERHEEK